MLVQEADVGLRPQGDVILIPALLAAAVPLLLLRHHLPPHLQQLLQLEKNRGLRDAAPVRSPIPRAPLPRYHLLLALLHRHVWHVVLVVLSRHVGSVGRLFALPLWGDVG